MMSPLSSNGELVHIMVTDRGAMSHLNHSQCIGRVSLINDGGEKNNRSRDTKSGHTVEITKL